MREFIGGPAIEDDDAISALRVIAHFDALVDRQATASAMIRGAAALAAVPVGMHDEMSGRIVRAVASGATNEDVDPSLVNGWPQLQVDSTRALWMERDEISGPLDKLILERCAQGIRTALPRPDAPLSSSAAVLVACDTDVTSQAREDALHQVGLHGEIDVIVLAAAANALSEPTAQVDGKWVVLTPARCSDLVVTGFRRASGVATTIDRDVPTAWRQASIALSLASVINDRAGTHSHCSVHYEHLGALGWMLEALDPSAAADSVDVQILARLARQRAWVPATLCHLIGQPSHRQAAALLHIHHSTLQKRMAWLEAQLGFSLRTPVGHLRAASAWILWHLADTTATS